MYRHVFTLGCAWFAAVAFAQTAEIDATVVDLQGRPVADAVVIAVPADALPPVNRPRESVVDQVDKEFVPRVVAIQVGTSVTFPNHDNVRHHVYSFSPPKRFELSLHAGVPAKRVVFDTPGVVVLGCNLHDWMVGYVYVSESPFFAKTDKDGKAKLSDLTPGAYFVRTWHPQLAVAEDTTRRKVDATHAGAVDVRWALELKPEVRVRRAPTPERRGGY
jgi:plastocyanin